MIQNWAEFIIGIWIMLSPWLLGFSNVAILKWSNVLCGLALILINAQIIFGKEHSDKEPENNNSSKNH